MEEQDNFLYSTILKKFQNNNNWVGAFVGPTGSGKSFGAIKIAYDLSKLQNLEFKADQVCFTPKEFYSLVEKRINGELGVGSIIVFDEAGIALDADKPRSEEDISGMKHIIQTFRKYRLGLIFTIPSGFGFMAKKIRSMVDTTFIMRGVNYAGGYSIAKCHWLQVNEYSAKIYTHTPVSYDDTEMSGLKIFKPPAALLEEYEKRKDDFARNLLKEKKDRATFSEEQSRKEVQGLDYYYKQVMKEPRLYLNKSETSFGAYVIIGRLGLPYQKAKALASRLDSDLSNGKISLRD